MRLIVITLLVIVATVSGGVVAADGAAIETSSDMNSVQDANAVSETQSLQETTGARETTTSRDLSGSSWDLALGNGALVADTANQTAGNNSSSSEPAAERTLSSDQVVPGGEVTVTVEAEAQGDTFTVSENFNPTVDDASIESITVNGDPPIPIASAADSTGATVALDGLNLGDNIVIEYRIGVSTDAEVGTNYSITGDVTNDGEASLGTDKIDVTKYAVERNLSSNQVAPGGELTVTTQTEARDSTLTISEVVTPAVNETEIESVTVGEDSVTPATETANATAVTVTVDDLNSSDSVRVEYTLNISTDADVGTNYSITGTVADSNIETSTKRTEFTIKDASPLDGAAGEYDEDNDGDVTASELGSAVADFGQGDVSASELGEVVTAFGQS
ncbi:hypothetical protein ACFQMF_15575 [Halorubrum rutilum]|uniref:EF-hand domain-containing protein n=1 Tax=Halorubrum rutilum TaxID=1364933 RepID=A0ABD6APT8_9EURY|nr:hypothetical protein [Halorubrum rutilum]